MDPITAMMLINAGLSVGQATYGVVQENKARKELSNLERPNYTIPDASKKSLDISQSLASNRNMPGQGTIDASIDAQTGNAIRDINRSGGSMADRLAAIANVYSNSSEQKAALGIQADQNYMNNVRSLQSSLNNMATYQERKRADELAAYNQKVASLQGLAGAGIQNAASGVMGLAGTANQSIGYNNQMNMMDQQHRNNMDELAALYGNNKNQPTVNQFGGNEQDKVIIEAILSYLQNQ